MLAVRTNHQIESSGIPLASANAIQISGTSTPSTSRHVIYIFHILLLIQLTVDISQSLTPSGCQNSLIF